MLKISIHDTPEQLKFKLEGRLIGPWVREVEQSWDTAQSVRNGRKAVFDLSDVTFIDDNGRDLLENLHKTGVSFIVADPMTCAIVEEVTGTPAQRAAATPKCKHLLRFTAILALLAAAQASAAPLKLTLKDAVQTALKQNPGVVTANLNIAQAQENTKLSRSALLPQVGISATDAARRVNIEAQIGVKFAGFPPTAAWRRCLILRSEPPAI